MQIPNLLNTAMKLVGKEKFQYFKWATRTGNAVGQYVSTYQDPIYTCGQVQAIERNLFQIYNLSFNKNYLSFFISRDILDIERDVSGDQIVFNKLKYNCLYKTDWRAMNGWLQVIAVQVP